MLVSNLTTEQRMALSGMFLSKGWEIVREELTARKAVALKALVYGEDHSRDSEYRAAIKAADLILGMAQEVFKAPPPVVEEPPPPPATGDVYRD